MEDVEQESGTGEAKSETEEDLESTSEHSEGLHEGEVHGLATVLGLSGEVPCAGISSLSPGNFLTIIISFTFKVEVNNEVFGVVVSALSVRSQHKVVAFISLSLSVEVVSGESGFMENIFASVSIKFIRGSFSGTKAHSGRSRW